ncbi:predicted protein [Naegleria gruberi]|uniref:Gamma-soluble NSF attachment protein n=1 Tax=Naegleria gruberi TaxID=5762 RepID=D2UY70_NAEGR|nr:uncharacterized protein NAEGRDRAFT_77767 [Naegleria gruberi]EFC50422.1 predicted protein [Naegleria gruberi]|eukprot:XP_002683166.1 predicted protein [Naegleria gruberi strain NEG-M]
MSAEKLKEADSLEKEGKKLTERSLFRWSPDWDTAASKFEKASLLYKNLGKDDKAVECYLRAGVCHEKNKMFYSAGKSYEMAANIYQNTIKDYISAFKNYKDAARLYLDDGKNDRAAEVLVKAAKSMEKEPNCLNQCVELYKEGIEASTMNGKYHNVTDILRNFNNFLIRHKLYTEAIQNLETQINAFRSLSQPNNERKAMLAIIILYLKNDDPVAAQNALDKFTNDSGSSGFCENDEGDVAIQLVSSFENRDERMLDQAKTSSVIKFLEGPVSKIGLTLSLNPLLDELNEKKKKANTPVSPSVSGTAKGGTRSSSSSGGKARGKAALFDTGSDDEEEDPKASRRTGNNSFLSGSSSSTNKPKTAFAQMPSKEELTALQKKQEAAFEQRQQERRERLERGESEFDDDEEEDGQDAEIPNGEGDDLTGATDSKQKAPQSNDDDDLEYVPSTKPTQQTDDFSKPVGIAPSAPAEIDDEEDENQDIFDPTDLT